MLNFLLEKDSQLENIQKETLKELSLVMVRAFHNASNSKCRKKKVGAVLTPLNSLFSTLAVPVHKQEGNGYGGWVKECVRCLRKEYDWQQDGCWSMHSEPRALFDYFEKYGFKKDLSDMVMVVTHGPCDQCLKYCTFFGIQNIVYEIPYHNNYIKWSEYINVFELTNSVLKKMN